MNRTTNTGVGEMYQNLYQNPYQPQYSYGDYYQDYSRPTPLEVSLDERNLASEREDLGDGFFLYKWNRPFPPNQTITYFLSANGQKVISGGWAPGGIQPSTILECYPRDKFRWSISIINSNVNRDLNLYLITKK
jgi:hypothetical protein